jgi:LytS/YehU family sensor histidine kinase
VTRVGVYAIAAVAAIAFAASVFVLTRGGFTVSEAVLAALPPSALFGFIGFASRFACRALPLRNTSFSRLAAAHVGAPATASGLWLLVWQRSLPPRVTADVSLLFALGALLYGVMITVHYLLLEVEASRQAEEAALRYQLLAREAELKAFKAQIDPHFLFNSLNAVAALCGSHPGNAREMTQLLADFFRQTLRLGALDRITLAQEIDLASRYLAIEKVRFGDRLGVRIDVDDAARERQVPPLLLQPLIENAVRHGIASTLDGGTVGVSASVRDGVLRISIENPADPDRADARGEGIGLQNARGRLAAISGGRAAFRTTESAGTYRVEIELPA